MAIYEIYNIDAGELLGRYDAPDEDSALDTLARDYGFADYAACVLDYGVAIADAKEELQVIRLDQ